ncbi:MAG: hypothetical protein KatS3mg110_4103 [Pirellulaceae bacterium]|nr:MAG: hypothetical protein KatS3mg110_4103 [Pirellulaceae bacterium]
MTRSGNSIVETIARLGAAELLEVIQGAGGRVSPVGRGTAARIVITLPRGAFAPVAQAIMERAVELKWQLLQLLGREPLAGWPADVMPPLWWDEMVTGFGSALIEARRSVCGNCRYPVAVCWLRRVPGQRRRVRTWSCPRCGRRCEGS